jgi:spore coat protein CotF
MTQEELAEKYGTNKGYISSVDLSQKYKNDLRSVELKANYFDK